MDRHLAKLFDGSDKGFVIFFKANDIDHFTRYRVPRTELERCLGGERLSLYRYNTHDIFLQEGCVGVRDKKGKWREYDATFGDIERIMRFCTRDFSYNRIAREVGDCAVQLSMF